MDSFRFPNDFQLGVSSAATQIEGGDTNNNWYDWAILGHIKDGANPAVADMHYERYKEDTDLMAQMHISHSRMGIEWSRIEPSEGVFDEHALQHYRDELLYMKEKGIRPLLTIHHFSNPSWFEQKGAFLSKDCVEQFLTYTQYVIKGLGDLVSEYITINEPNVYAMNGYFGGEFPPGHNSFPEYSRVLTNMTACHIASYKIIHKMRQDMGFSDTKVSFAIHLRSFVPKSHLNIAQIACAAFAKKCFQTSITRAMAFGEHAFPVSSNHLIKPGLYIDFWGVNYYSRSTIAGLKDGVRKNAPVNDLGWEIYPEGIVECCREMHQIKPLDIYITENGTCDNQDTFRCRYLYEHIKELCDCGLPIKRYYHWCFVDNFEWLEGESARFGLVHNDYRTQKRTIKKSGRFYTEMIDKREITPEMIQTYCQCTYNNN